MIISKRITVSAAVLFSLCSYAAIPVEWNVNRKTDVPYEIELDRAKISRIAEVSADHSYKVTAVTADGKKELPVTMLESNKKDKVLVRFEVPAGTTALSCTPVEKSAVFTSSAECGNIFAGILSPEKWKSVGKKGKVTVKSCDGGLVFETANYGMPEICCKVDVPEGAAGKPVRLSMTVQSLSKMTWRNPIYLAQYDEKNRKIDTSTTDPRWISHLRPPQTVTRYIENGVIHPRAKKIAVCITLGSQASKMDNYGMPLKDKGANLPKLKVTELALRIADTLPFPKYRDTCFADGVSGKSGDCSLDLRGKGCFYFASTGQAVWAENKQLRNILDSFFPFGDGTVECWINANKWHKNPNILMQAANTINSVKGLYLKRRGPLFEVSYDSAAEKINLYLKDAADKEFKKSVKYPLKPKQWYHIAAQWTKKNGVRLFVNGKAVITDTEYKFQAVDMKKEKYPNTINAHQFTLGTHISGARGTAVNREKFPEFDGRFDLLRISSIGRYNRNFVPAKSFKVDRSTRAVFDFDRSFNGRSFGSTGIIEGTTRDIEGRQDKKISFNGKKVQYTPEQICDDSHQDKVLNRLNYPVLPAKEDFLASNTVECTELKLKPNEKHTITLDRDVVMESIEFTNNGKKALNHPAVIRKGEVDPRSFGDIADTLDLETTPHRERAYKIFNFLLGASDYFINYQVEFFPDRRLPREAIQLALVMLNSYCGFECGPLNNLAAILFSCSGAMPSSQTAGYAHSFEQVFYDGKNHLYDLSAQKFFPSFDNESAASLNETELQSGIFCRIGGRADHFVRLTTRGFHVNNIDFMEKVGVSVKPGETLKVFFANNGKFNELNMSGVFRRKVTQDVEDFSGKFDFKTKYPIRRVPRPFPHFGSSFLLFNAAPAKHPAAFADVKDGSFTYSVNSSYPIVAGTYRAELAAGKCADMEFSADGGKTFKKLSADADGSYTLKYEIMGHHKPVLRINAAMKDVRKFTASTQMMTNPRVLTGKLRKGVNELTFKATSGDKTDIRIRYSSKTAPIAIEKGVYAGGIPGYERQLAAVEPGKALILKVSGITSDAKVSASEKLSARLEGGKLYIKAHKDAENSFGQVIIRDRGREKRLTVITAKGVKLLTPADAELAGGAKLVKADSSLVQDCIYFNKVNSKAVFKTELPAGKYQIWNLNRFESHIRANHAAHKKRDLHLKIGKYSNGMASTGNVSCNFYKAQFGKPGERSNFKWDFPLTKKTTYPYHRPETIEINGANKIEVYQDRTCQGGVELAALLVVPSDDPKFVTEMMKVLGGLNNEQWKVNENVAEFFKR